MDRALRGARLAARIDRRSSRVSLKDRDPPTPGTRATGEQIKSCTTIITGPNDFVAEVHDRMPVLLTEEQFAPWLSAHH